MRQRGGGRRASGGRGEGGGGGNNGPKQKSLSHFFGKPKTPAASPAPNSSSPSAAEPAPIASFDAFIHGGSQRATDAQPTACVEEASPLKDPSESPRVAQRRNAEQDSGEPSKRPRVDVVDLLPATLEQARTLPTRNPENA